MKKLNALAAIATLASLSVIAYADRGDVLAAINAKPKCDQKGVADALKPIPLDEEIVLESLKAGCTGFTVDAIKLKTWSESDSGKNSVTVALKYQTYFDKELIAPLKTRVDAGNHLSDADIDAESAGFGLEFVKAIKSQHCKGTGKPVACNQLDPAKSESLLMAVLTKSEKNKGGSDIQSILNEACPMLDELHYHEGVIANEKEAAKISGMVDKQKMYESGKVITHHKKELAPLEAAYKRKTGQKLTLEKCPAKFRQ